MTRLTDSNLEYPPINSWIPLVPEGAPKTIPMCRLAAAIVAAASGAKVAKHGNRSRTGRGSAEVLDALGVNVDAGREIQKSCMEAANVCFCFAIHHHPAAKHAMPVRKALGFPTLFNLLGPLTNPAGAGRQVMGVYRPEFVRPVAEALSRLDSVRALVMHSDEGLDEFSLGAPSTVAQVDSGKVTEYRVDPVEMGLRPTPYQQLQARDLDHAVELVKTVLSGENRGPERDIVLLNAAAAIYAADGADSLESALEVAAQSIDFGTAMQTLDNLVEASNSG